MALQPTPTHPARGPYAAMTPAQMLTLANVLRRQAIAVAGPAGLDLPVDQVHVGEQILTIHGWQTVEQVHADTWCCDLPNIPGHRYRVIVVTDAHQFYEHGHEYVSGDMVRVRAGAQ